MGDPQALGPLATQIYEEYQDDGLEPGTMALEFKQFENLCNAGGLDLDYIHRLSEGEAKALLAMLYDSARKEWRQGDRAMIHHVREAIAAFPDGHVALFGFGVSHEAEVMISQTIHASVVNYEKRGICASVLALKADRRGSRNTRGLQQCVDRRWFDIENGDGETLVYPTKALVHAILAHVSKR